MPRYDFVCDMCGKQVEKTFGLNDSHTVECHGLMRKLMPKSFGFHRTGFYSPGLGKEITSQRAYKNDLKQKSEEMTERTGMVHDFQPVDLNDTKSLGVDNRGIGDKLPHV